MSARLSPQLKTSLFVCDIQTAFEKAIFGYHEVVNTTDKMIKAAALLDIDVVLTEQSPSKLGHTHPILLKSLEDNKFVTGNTHFSGSIAKELFSMVVPEVEQNLKFWGTKNVIIVGIESHVCVLQTTIDLIKQGYNVFILSDGVSSCNYGEVPVALSHLTKNGAHVISSESALFQIMGSSSHPAFRSISKLIKETKNATKTAMETLKL